MQIVNYVSKVAIPFSILMILVYGLVEKNKVFDTFLDGAKEGIEITVKIFPSLVGLFVAIGALRSSGIIDLIVQMLSPILQFLKIPYEIMPLAMLRPISRKCIYGCCNRYNEGAWGRYFYRQSCIYNYGVYRDHFIHYCYIYRCGKNKKNKVCFSGSFNRRCHTEC